MPDLQHQPALPRQRPQLIRLRQRGGDRFFHQHMLARPQRPRRQVVMGSAGAATISASDAASKASKSISLAPASQPRVLARSRCVS